MSKVFILVTVTNAEMLRSATMVFSSIRVGFPTAKICVAYNQVPLEFIAPLEERMKDAGAEHVAMTGFPFGHHRWLVSLIENETEPFFVCDPDIAFWSDFERFDFSGCAMAGRYVRQFHCLIANAVTRPRLHTCLLYMDPVRIKSAVNKYLEQFPDLYACPRPSLADLVLPLYVPYRFGAIAKTFFHDTLCLLYQAIGGRSFTDDQNLAFDHLQCSTFSLEASKCYPKGNIREHHFAVMDNPSLLKGQWERDKGFYDSRACD